VSSIILETEITINVKFEFIKKLYGISMILKTIIFRKQQSYRNIIDKKMLR